MSEENDAGLLTESFEQAMTSFYNAARDANPRSDTTLNTFPVNNSVRAVVEEFQKTVRCAQSLPSENNEYVSTRMNDELSKSAGILFHVPELKKTVENDSRITSEPTIQSPHPTSPKLKETAPLVLPKKPTVASALETTAKTSHAPSRIPEDIIMDYLPDPLKPQLTSNYKIVLRTLNPSHIIDFEWSLENFSNYIEDLHSPFFAGDGCTKNWQARIALTSNNSNVSRHMEFSMNLISKFKATINGYFNLGVYNSKGEAFGKWESVAEFTDNMLEHSCFKTDRPAGCKSSNDLKLDDDELFIKGRIAFTGCCVSTTLVVKKPMLTSNAAC